MATIYAASNSPIDSAMARLGGGDMDESQARRHLSIPTPISIDGPMDDDVSSSSPQPSPRFNNLPPPNPPFVFPARSSPSSAPSSFSRASGNRPKSLVESQEMPPFNPGAQPSPNCAATDLPQRSPALPSFSFNPGATLESDTSALSPPLSPSSPRMIPNRRGHQRGGSEFVGGKLKEGESITLMSTSPTKSESGFASPTLAPVDRSARRGRHAHRRSAAISSHDLSMILKPPGSSNPSRGSSAPSSPADFEEKARPFPETSAELYTTQDSEPENTLEETREEVPPIEDGPEEKPVPRARVGFSDTLEFIPRPLSMVSTDTASTVTGHPGHSVSGSISSIISLANSTIADRDRPTILSSPVSSSCKKGDSRPSTAGAILERTPSLLGPAADQNSPSPRRRNSIPLLPGIPTDGQSPPALPSPSKVPKRWSFFGLESFASSGSPTKQRPHSSSSSETATKATDSAAVLPEIELNSTINGPEPQSAVKKSSSRKKKQKKVKSWAGSILTRKTRTRSQKAKANRRRSQTPPLPRDDDMDDYEADMSGPLTAPMVMVTGTHTVPELTRPDLPRWKSEDDVLFPMIDLDAALGPFNTPSARDPAWDAAQRAGAPQKRQLHSAAGMRGFSGPGMHYHRRAESAPEMPPFEAARFGIHRFGSSSTMADVFEEDEEDEDEDDSGTSSSSDDSTPDASGTSFVDPDTKSAYDDAASTPTQEGDLDYKNSKESISVPTSIKRKGSGSSLEMQPPGSRARIENSANSLHEEVIVEEAPVQMAVDQERIFETFQESADSAAPSPRRIITNKDLAPVEIHPLSLPGPTLAVASPYSMSHSSPFPSPRSPMSYDAHRVSTAPSSVTEENTFQSLLMGEPGPEVVRISVDVPSLTSSNSTMTRESNYPGVRPRNMAFHEQRPASFTSTAFGRRRSSLASLSRLISTSHGERSKLSTEVPVDSEPEKKTKSSTTKRWSRMMQFWKPKESETS
ncbi:cell wall proline rich protein [Xylariales sp. AK1849]|nr:cell wall proline rich protein [Xylariales sp. AK1849]